MKSQSERGSMKIMIVLVMMVWCATIPCRTLQYWDSTKLDNKDSTAILLSWPTVTKFTISNDEGRRCTLTFRDSVVVQSEIPLSAAAKELFWWLNRYQNSYTDSLKREIETLRKSAK